jgi:hypothetical protein
MEIDNGNENNSNKSISEITTYSANVKQASQSEEENLSTTKIVQQLMHLQNYQEEADDLKD